MLFFCLNAAIIIQIMNYCLAYRFVENSEVLFWNKCKLIKNKMEKNEKLTLAKSLMLTVREFGLEEEMRQMLDPAEKSSAECPKKTSNGFEIYFDEETGEAVGIIHNGIVHLKKTSPKPMSWYQALLYCETVVINGIRSELCPADLAWTKEFRRIYVDLDIALEEIGGENLDETVWCKSCSEVFAGTQCFFDGYVGASDKTLIGYVRPVLVLPSKRNRLKISDLIDHVCSGLVSKRV